MSVLLIYPAAAKFCEPPPGIARLCGSLRQAGISCQSLDLNLECMLGLIGEGTAAADTWSRRAQKNRFRHLDSLHSASTYQSPARYRRAVGDLERLLNRAADPAHHTITLTNYQDHKRSALVSSHLREMAESFAESPFYPYFSQKLETILNADCPQLIGISLSYISQALCGFAIIGFIRHYSPQTTIVLGGGLITSWLTNTREKKPFGDLVDHLVTGPGEQELLELLGKTSASRIGPADYRDFDFNNYLAPGPIIPYATSDGCYWEKCTFCPDRAEKTPFELLPTERIDHELASLINQHQPCLVHFLDNAIPPTVLHHLIRRSPGVPWYGFARFEKILEDPDFCTALKKCGCIMLKLGLESGSQRVLDSMHKGINLRSVSLILDNLKKSGIATYIYLLFGTPYESMKEAEETLSFVKKKNDTIGFLNLAIFNMPICAPEAKYIPNRFSEGDLSLYCDFTHPRGWDRKTVRTFLHNRFKKEPVIQKILNRDPPSFTSNHAPFFL